MPRNRALLKLLETERQWAENDIYINNDIDIDIDTDDVKPNLPTILKAPVTDHTEAHSMSDPFAVCPIQVQLHALVTCSFSQTNRPTNSLGWYGGANPLITLFSLFCAHSLIDRFVWSFVDRPSRNTIHIQTRNLSRCSSVYIFSCSCTSLSSLSRLSLTVCIFIVSHSPRWLTLWK